MRVYNNICMYLLVIMFVPFVLHGAQPLPLIKSPHSSEIASAYCRRHIALLAIDPSDSAPKLLLSSPGRTHGNWGLFSGHIKEHAKDILSSQTSGFYSDISDEEHLGSSIHEQTGDILNIITGSFADREKLLGNAKNKSRKNFHWVNLDSIRDSQSTSISRGFDATIMIDESVLCLLKDEWKMLSMALRLLSSFSDLMASRACLLAPAVPSRILIRNELSGALDNVCIRLKKTVLMSIERLREADDLRLDVLSGDVNSFFVQASFMNQSSFMNNVYTYLIESPISKANRIVFLHDIETGDPRLIYAPTSSDKIHWNEAQLVKCSLESTQPVSAPPQSALSIKLYNANMDITKIKIRDKNKVITRGIPENSEKTIWQIPVSKNNGKYYLEIISDEIAYTWKINFLDGSCELLLIKSDSEMPMLKMLVEGAVQSTLIVPLVAANRLQKVT